jgi:hypothetical protein
LLLLLLLRRRRRHGGDGKAEDSMRGRDGDDDRAKI